MIRMNSLAEMATHLATAAITASAAEQAGLAKVLKLIEQTAKSEFGHYQPEVGPFPGWPELAEATKNDRVAQGYSENDPLLRSGDLAASVTTAQEPNEGIVGVPAGPNGDKMIWHEFGTENMPARPVLGPAAFRNTEEIQKILGAAVVAGILGARSGFGPASPIHGDLGYDMETKD